MRKLMNLYINLIFYVMVTFRKRPPVHLTDEPCNIRLLDFVDQACKTGDVVRKEVVKVLDVHDFHVSNPHPKEEYTIQQQLDAGVSLRETSVNLDSGDNLDYAVNETAEQDLLDRLQLNQ